ncbi:hypothetical protein C7Y66_04055 [Chroococcidiopsis sp. CCALA 051]|uniref:DUF928 domain-containing protein n=1 Tax=Chroococcidiopsis sp. CCALA 051 TaxID=869949 RepID=UPI000D0D97F3|nr:DUF928 domain-containing protein [Chroococcidiopsis sp. CCALA 051]MBE9017238.1 DUF928 domain-containing protein [Chroococcidiopsidales cyanobacterium LEGE 13417]PSM50472.1 hypothetical protein C7Y66_04055 [Chroococcidiopsis sp. CCALA 051]
MHKLAATAAIAFTLLVPTAAIATHNNSQNHTHQQVSAQPRYTPPPFPTSGTPTGRTRGAAGRGGDCGFKLPLTALAPAVEKTVGTGKATYVWGQTIAEYPTFWFYIPAANPSLRSVEFVLQDDRDNDVYRSAVELPAKPGIIGVRLPSTQPPLKLNQNYHWFLKTEIAASCDRQDSTIAIKDSVEGWVQRVSPTATMRSQLKTATPEQRLDLYAQQGLWYDAIATIAEQRLQQPENAVLKANWHGLLQSANLSDMTSQPLLP